MKILHFSTCDIAGGAAKAAYRQHRALCASGYDSVMFVRYKFSCDKSVARVRQAFNLKAGIERLKRPVIPFVFNYDSGPDVRMKDIFSLQPGRVDFINLCWITDFLTVNAIKELYDFYKAPILWTLMDMEPITGGCHYSFGCKGYMHECGDCPIFKSAQLKGIVHDTWRRKRDILGKLPITFIAPTSWVASRIRESSLFGGSRIEYAPLVMDTGIFKLADKSFARQALGIPQDKKVIFFGAHSLTDPRKGMQYLEDALHILVSMTESGNSLLKREDVFILTAGNNADKLSAVSLFSCKNMGLIKNDTVLATAYQAADIFVSPSIEDAGPMMIPEAMLCGTPVAAFNTGGAVDLIETMKTGYLAACADSAGLAKGIYSLLSSPELETIRMNAHKAAVKKHSFSDLILIGKKSVTNVQ